MPTKSLRITVKAPRGTKAGDTVAKKAQAAAQAVIDEYGDLYQTVAALNKQGISITVEELLSRREKAAKPSKKKTRRKKVGRKKVGRKKVGRKKAGRKKVGRKKVARKKAGRKKAAARKVATRGPATRKKARRKSKRTVLTPEQRKDLTDMLRSGATAAKAAAKFGVSTATVNNIKRAAGLTVPRKKKVQSKAD